MLIKFWKDFIRECLIHTFGTVSHVVVSWKNGSGDRRNGFFIVQSQEIVDRIVNHKILRSHNVGRLNRQGQVIKLMFRLSKQIFKSINPGLWTGSSINRVG